LPLMPAPTSNWKTLYAKAMQEQDSKRIESILAAEEAIVRRMQELGKSSEDDAERAALNASADDLLKIKTEKTGKPGM
jgi:hypothetical protein